jgi:hypothetical protein
MYVRLFALSLGPTVDWYDVARVTIDVLPDVALLEIFDFYMDKARMDAWHKLVHVCRKWRHVVFGSPRRLNLRLDCRARTRVRERLDVWPPLPIVILGSVDKKLGVDNILAALEHNDRTWRIDLWGISSSQLEKILAAMRQPFPELTSLYLKPSDETALVDPDSFLGGSAQGLRKLWLDHVSFSGLPRLLLSATHLVSLYLWNIPHSGYISPEAMVAALSALTKLEILLIGFKSPRSRPDRQRPPPQTRTVLPVLTKLRFFGVGKYLEDLVARIDAPLLYKFQITFFHQLIFDTPPQLTRFISRTPKFRACKGALVIFSKWDVSVTLPQTFNGVLELGISCGLSDWQISSVAQVCGSSFPQVLIPAVEHLYILDKKLSEPRWQEDIESSQWLELFHPFTAAKALYISREFAPRVVPALQELVGERVTEALPSLQTLFFEETLPSGPIQEAVEQFVAARQLAGHPVTVSRWVRKNF